MSEISGVSHSRIETRSTYDRISRWYDLLAGRWEQGPKDTALQLLSVREGETVLEVGFGTGQALLFLARSAGSSGRVYGVDLSQGMIRITRSRLARSGFTGRTMITCGDAVHLPFQTSVLNIIFMSFTLELFDKPEIPLVLGECRRVLKKDGRMGVVSLSKTGRTNWSRKLYEWGNQRWPGFLDCRPIFVQRALEQVGFVILGSQRSSVGSVPVEIVLASR